MSHFCPLWDLIVIAVTWYCVVHFNSFAFFLLFGLSPRAWRSF